MLIIIKGTRDAAGFSGGRKMNGYTMVERPSATERADSAGVKKRGILLVEDYGPNIVMMTMFFEELGYECDIAETGMEALDKFCATRYDIVVMDLQLPDIDGLETTRRMRLWEKSENLTPTPIIASSGSSSEADQIFCRKTGMDDCLTKPLQLDELEKKLAQWMPPA
jgi:CheY-like chemotaxis protein